MSTSRDRDRFSAGSPQDALPSSYRSRPSVPPFVEEPDPAANLEALAGRYLYAASDLPTAEDAVQINQLRALKDAADAVLSQLTDPTSAPDPAALDQLLSSLALDIKGVSELLQAGAVEDSTASAEGDMAAPEDDEARLLAWAQSAFTTEATVPIITDPPDPEEVQSSLTQRLSQYGSAGAEEEGEGTLSARA